MCAINPAHQHHYKLSVYTSDAKINSKQFMDRVMGHALQVELELNSNTAMRWHINDLDLTAIKTACIELALCCRELEELTKQPTPSVIRIRHTEQRVAAVQRKLEVLFSL